MQAIPLHVQQLMGGLKDSRAQHTVARAARQQTGRGLTLTLRQPPTGIETAAPSTYALHSRQHISHSLAMISGMSSI